jgi:hypothetical protein
VNGFRTLWLMGRGLAESHRATGRPTRGGPARGVGVVRLGEPDAAIALSAP